VSDASALHRRACELFTELLELDGEARASRLAERAAGDAKLRSEVLAMLAADDGALGAVDAIESLIASAVAPIMAEGEVNVPGSDPLIGTRIGGFSLDRLIAVGGNGTCVRGPTGVAPTEPWRSSSLTFVCCRVRP
jgi:hypothetical protein